jgi:hypothetical protein
MMRVCEAAILVLKEHKQPSVMWGDEWLLHQIAKKKGWPSEGPRTSKRVLSALAKTPGTLIKSLIPMPNDHICRGMSVLCFELPPAKGGDRDAGS